MKRKKNRYQKKRILHGKDRRKQRGSLTVEASLVVPMCVMAVAVLLALTFYVYLRCWYTQTACEAAMQGSGYGVLEGREGVQAAEKKWRTRRSESGWSGKEISGEITGGTKEVQVKTEGRVSVWGRQDLQFTAKIRQAVIRPVSFVRKVAACRT